MRNDSAYKSYLEQIQQPAGWFDFAVTVVRMMALNARDGEDHAFLHEAGQHIAEIYPLPKAKGLEDLSIAMNSRLDAFKWGKLEITDSGDSLALHHLCMPAVADPAAQNVWQNSFVWVLCGLYAAWLRQSGAPADLSLAPEKIIPPDEAVFRLRRI